MPDSVEENEEKDPKEDDSSEVIEVESSTVSSDVEDVFSDGSELIDEGGDGFWDLLEQSGITVKTVFWAVGGLVFGIVVLLFFIFKLNDLFGSSAPSNSDSSSDTANYEEDDSSWFSWGDDSSDEESDSSDVNNDSIDVYVNDSNSENIYVDDTAVYVQNDFNYDTPAVNTGAMSGVVASYIFGLEFNDLNVVRPNEWGGYSGLEASFVFGDTGSEMSSQFVKDVELLRSMDNVFNTDVYDFVNMHVDRRGALDLYLTQLADLIEQGNNSLLYLEDSMESLKIQYDQTAEQRDNYENEFFAQLDVLNAEPAYENMQYFLDFSKSATDLRVYYNSQEQLRDMFQSALSFLEPRYQDVFINQDAILKGVHVFDVSGSEIDAILSVEEL